MAADHYPDRPVTIVVPYAAGGGIDTVTRMAAQHLSERLGQTFVVENRLGAGGVIATTYAARAKPDGYTLLMASDAQFAIQVALRKSLAYDPTKDFEPIGMAGSTPFALVVHPSVPAKSVKELIALAKSKPGELTYGSSGVGGTPHLVMEMFTSVTGIKMRHIPYKGTAQGLNDLIGGRLNTMFSGLTGVTPLLKAGQLRALGVSSRTRLKVLPSVPTVAEAAVPGFEAVGFVMLAAPAGTPKGIVDKLAAELAEFVKSPDVEKKYDSIGYLAEKSPSPAELKVFIKQQIGRWGDVVAKAGLTHSQ
jgi:tripartite-type tricarboxylate transporter receptor subunit TctC